MQTSCGFSIQTPSLPPTYLLLYSSWLHCYLFLQIGRRFFLWWSFDH